MARDFAGNSSSKLLGTSFAGGPPWLLSANYPWTIAAWMNPDVASNFSVLALGDDALGQTFIHLNVNGSGGAQFGRFSARNQLSTTVHAITTNTYSLNSWSHLVGRTTGPFDRVCTLNGDIANQGTNAIGRFPSWKRVGIGHIPRLSPSSFFNGQIAECAFWNRILTDSEVIFLSQGYSALHILDGLVWYRDLRGVDTDLDRPFLGSDTDALTSSSTTLVAHPPQLVYPDGVKRRRARFPAQLIPHDIEVDEGIEVIVVEPTNPVIGL